MNKRETRGRFLCLLIKTRKRPPVTETGWPYKLLEKGVYHKSKKCLMAYQPSVLIIYKDYYNLVLTTLIIMTVSFQVYNIL